MRLSVEKPWTKVKYANKKNIAAKKGMQKQKPSRRRIFFPKKEVQPKRLKKNIILALNKHINNLLL